MDLFGLEFGLDGVAWQCEAVWALAWLVVYIFTEGIRQDEQ